MPRYLLLGGAIDQLTNYCYMDVISGGARGAEAPPIILMIQKFFYVNYTAFRRSENASTSITNWWITRGALYYIHFIF